ncbi:hypothetical protein [Owenweeksia hongkongensis]|nr:hypothetical protein [Owenweeksia hongkongensis]
MSKIFTFILIAFSFITFGQYEYSSWNIDTGGVIPPVVDSVFIEAEHFETITGIKYSGSGLSNDTVIGNLNTSPANYIETTVNFPVDSIAYMIQAPNAGTIVRNIVNGVDSTESESFQASSYELIGVKISLDAGDVLRIRCIANYVGIDYVIFYYNYTPTAVIPTPPEYDAEYSVEENWYAGTYLGDVPAGYDLVDGYSFADNYWFRVSNDSLFTMTSFDYELKESYDLSVFNGSEFKTLRVDIDNLTGKWDSNVKADADLAAKYYDVEIGDLLIVQPTNASNQIYYMAANSLPDTVASGSQIKIRGGFWRGIAMNLDIAQGDFASRRLTVTNWLGQVESAQGFGFINAYAVRFTGEYSAENRTGNINYRGDVDSSYQARQFGFYANNMWMNGIHAFAVGGEWSKVEIDHVEIDGAFTTGFNIKQDNGIGNPDSNHIHNNLVKNCINEGLYLGNTKAPPQQLISNTIVENNLFIANGSETQCQRLNGGNILRNNVTFTGLSISNSFQFNQSNAEQHSYPNGGNTSENNIAMGFAELGLFLYFNAGEAPVNGDTNYVRNNLYWKGRGHSGAYIHSSGDSITPIKISDLYFGEIGYDLDSFKVGFDTTGGVAIYSANTINPIIVERMTFDKTLQSSANTIENVTVIGGSRVDTISSPNFINAFGNHEFDPHRFYHWTAIKGPQSHNCEGCYYDGDPMYFRVGDVVPYRQLINHSHLDSAYRTVVYKCTTKHHGVEPGADEYWQDYWNILYYGPDSDVNPPYDFRLVEGTDYEVKGMGLNM